MLIINKNIKKLTENKIDLEVYNRNKIKKIRKHLLKKIKQ